MAEPVHNVVCCMRLGRNNVIYHITPIAMHPQVTQLILIRPNTIDATIANVVQATPYIKKSLIGVLCTVFLVVRHARNKDVKALFSFYAMPYGFMTLFAGKLWQKPVHIGFVGDDWYRIICKKWAFLLRVLLRRADFFTCTGTHMRDEMIARGFPAEKIAILPHCIDLNRTHITDPKTARYDCVFVGYLLQNKRLDTILRACAVVAQKHINTRWCIVGDGPLRNELRELCAQLDIENHVEFVGHTTDVYQYLSQSRISIIASESEGFPFATVEAMCCGLVPICTPVGTIPDYITHGENGMIFPVGDHHALAECICQLLEDKALYDRLRAKVLAMRDQFSYEKATEVWDLFLRNCIARTRSQKSEVGSR